MRLFTNTFTHFLHLLATEQPLDVSSVCSRCDITAAALQHCKAESKWGSIYYN